MKKVVSAAEMREIDRLTTEKHGIPSLLLMENAATAVFEVIRQKLGGSVSGRSVLIFCGKGNNGGDGAALARLLCEAGASVYVVLLGKIDDTKGDALHNFQALRVYNDNVKVKGEGESFFYAGDDPEEGRLAGARGAEQRYKLARRDAQINGIESTMGAEALRYPAHLNPARRKRATRERLGFSRAAR